MIKIKQPLIILDNSFRNNLFSKKLFHKLAKILRILFFNLFLRSILSSRRTAYYFFLFFPKVTILIVFLLDTFLFKELNLFYKMLPLGMISLLFLYVKYALEHLYTEYLIYLETYYEVDIIQIYSDPEEASIFMIPADGKYKFTVRTFLSEQSMIKDYNEVKFKCQLTWNVGNKYFPNIAGVWDDFSAYDEQQRNIMEKDFYNLIPVVRDIYNFFEYYNLILENPKVVKTSKLLNIFVYSGYLLGWLYILIVSIHTLHFSDLDNEILLLIFSIKDIYEPFSNTLLEPLFELKKEYGKK